MKKTAVIIVFACVCILGLPSAYGGNNVVPSTIKEVTLFVQGAEVTRESEVSLDKGINRILIELKAGSVDTNSVSAKVFAEGEVYSVQYRRIYLKNVPQEKVQKLQEQLKELNRTKEKLIHSRDVLYKGRDFLQGVIDFSKTQIPEDIKTSSLKPDEAGKLLSFITSSYAASYEQEESLEKKLEDVNEEIVLVNRRISELTGKVQREKKAIEIVFNSRKRLDKARVKVTYLVRGASWVPLYRADVPPDLSGIEMVMMAKITQVTGEDWNNVLLTVSNSYPWRGVGLPSPSPWQIAAVPAYPASRMSDKVNMLKLKGVGMMEKSAYGGEHATEAAEQISPADFAYAQLKSSPLSFEYKFAQPVTIPSADKKTYVALVKKDVKGEFFYYTYPRLSPMVFLVCRVTGDEEFLPGPINVYFGGKFLGQTSMSEKKAGVEFMLNLGVARGVVVKRTKVKDEIKETFFRKIDRKTIIRRMAFKINVENMKDKPVKVHLLDSVPVSRTDRIEVKDLKLSPSPDKKNYQDKKGVNLWIFDLAPRKKKEVNTSFTVTYPKDMPIYGL